MRSPIYTKLPRLLISVLCVAAAAGCVGPDPVFRFGVQTDDAGSNTGAGGSTVTGAGGSSPTGAGGSSPTGAGGSSPTGRGGSGGTSPTGAGGAGGTSPTGAGGSAPGGAPGTALFMDDFENGIRPMTWIDNTAGEWSIVMDGTTNVYKESVQTNAVHVAAVGDARWTDITVEAKVKVLSFGGSGTGYFAGPCVRFLGENDYSCAVVRSDGRFGIRSRATGQSGTFVANAPSGFTIPINTWHTFKLAVQGSTVTGYVDGMMQATGPGGVSTPGAGSAALITINAIAEFDDVVVTAN